VQRYTPPDLPEWITTAQVAEAAGVSVATILRWKRRGVLPAPEVVHGGTRGHQARWPLHAPEQARWVLARLEARETFEEIAAALARGEFKYP